jgi:molybdopterin converting factor small subunit
MANPMNVQFYGKLASLLGRQVELAVEEPCTVGEVRQRIVELRPEAAESLADRRVRACVDGTLVGDDHSLRASDTVEFLAPVSGG